MCYSVLTGQYSFKEAVKSTRCGFAILFDDVVNGNITQDGQNFFMGLDLLKVDITDLKNEIASFRGSINPITSNGTVTSEILTETDTAMDNLKKVPDGSGGPLVLSYPSPIDADTPTGTVDSLFPEILGTSA